MPRNKMSSPSPHTVAPSSTAPEARSLERSEPAHLPPQLSDAVVAPQYDARSLDTEDVPNALTHDDNVETLNKPTGPSRDVSQGMHAQSSQIAPVRKLIPSTVSD